MPPVEAAAILARITELEASKLSLEDRVCLLEEKLRALKPRREP